MIYSYLFEWVFGGDALLPDWIISDKRNTEKEEKPTQKAKYLGQINLIKADTAWDLLQKFDSCNEVKNDNCIPMIFTNASVWT